MTLKFRLFLIMLVMSQTINGKEYSTTDLEQIRNQQIDIIRKDKGNVAAICELVCADALLCEEYHKDMGPYWLNAGLCHEICRYMPAIIEMGDNLVMAENVCERAAQALWHHPRLKLRLLMLQRDAIIAQGGDRADDAEMGIDELSAEISQLQLNILAADQGRWDDIVDSGHLKRDPVEWTEAFEDAISDAQAKANKRLEDAPRCMGFCFAWWGELADILLRDYKIRWRSPQVMNPRVMFD